MYEKNLSYEFKEILNEAKDLALKDALSDVSSTTDENEIMSRVKAAKTFGQLMDLCGVMFQRQEELMNKMDRILNDHPKGE